jgi:hypothetical protein
MGKAKYIAITGFLMVMLAFGTYNAFGTGVISGTGWNQGDVATYLGNILTMGNETKSDHNTVMGSYSTTRANYNALQTKYNTLFSKMSTLNYRVMHASSFENLTGSAASKIIMGNQRATVNPDSTVLTPARTTTTDLTLTIP